MSNVLFVPRRAAYHSIAYSNGITIVIENTNFTFIILFERNRYVWLSGRTNETLGECCCERATSSIPTLTNILEKFQLWPTLNLGITATLDFIARWVCRRINPFVSDNDSEKHSLKLAHGKTSYPHNFSHSHFNYDSVISGIVIILCRENPM